MSLNYLLGRLIWPCKNFLYSIYNIDNSFSPSCNSSWKFCLSIVDFVVVEHHKWLNMGCYLEILLILYIFPFTVLQQVVINKLWIFQLVLKWFNHIIIFSSTENLHLSVNHTNRDTSAIAKVLKYLSSYQQIELFINI